MEETAGKSCSLWSGREKSPPREPHMRPGRCLRLQKEGDSVEVPTVQDAVSEMSCIMCVVV